MKIIFGLLLGLQAFAQNDPLFSRQWYLQNNGSQTIPISIDSLETIQQAGVAGVDIGWAEAQEQILTLQKNPTLVAVIDYGVDPQHPDLAGRISADGYDFLKKTAVMSDDFGHGTNIAGILVANSNNSIGTAGVTGPNIKVLPLKVLGKDFKNFAYNNRLISDYVADAVRYAIQKKAAVINLSLGWPKLVDSENSRRAIQEAIAQGIVVVAAAGNDLKQQPTYPCAYAGVICVGAVTNTGALSLYSNWGGKVDVLAPGDYMLSTYPTALESESARLPGYEALSGTSQAAPLISAMAAILKSSNPAMSVKEVTGRILLAAGTAPTYKGMAAAQYGLARLPNLLTVAANPVYQVDYKSFENLLVEEKTLTTSGNLNINNLLGEALNVDVQLFINGKLAGQLHMDHLGGQVALPWTYTFANLDESADLKFELKVTDSVQTKTFAANLVASRKSLDVDSTLRFSSSAQNSKVQDWITRNSLGRLAGKLGVVSSCSPSAALPEYFRIQGADANGMTLEMMTFTNSLQIQRVTIPAVANLIQVIHCRDHLSKDFAWVITSLWKDDQGATYFQFYFLDDNLKPFSQMPLRRYKARGNVLDGMIPRNYASPGSWVRHSSGELVPAFLDVGLLPPLDNFDAFDPRSRSVSQHLYYLETTNKTGIGEMQLRALDNKQWIKKYPELSILQPLPQSKAEMQAGSRQFLFGNFSNNQAPVQILTVTDLGQVKLTASQWSRVDILGDRVPVLSTQAFSEQMAFVAYTDIRHGSLTWTNSQAQHLDRSEFTYSKVGDPFVGKILGIFETAPQEKYWFLQSHNNLVGFFQDDKGQQQQTTFSLERDSSFEASSFNLLFAPVIVGTEADPLPGIFVDSTQIVGNRVNVVTYQSSTNKMERLLRHSLSVPDSCINMAPIRTEGAKFSVPLVCLPMNASEAFSVHFVQP